MNRKIKHQKFILPAVLCLLFSAFLTACSQKAAEPAEVQSAGSLYTTETIEIPQDLSAFSHFCFAGDGWYAVSTEKTGEEIPQSVIDEAAKNKTEVENDGRYDVYTTKLWHISLDGSVKQLKEYEPLQYGENTENWKKFGSVSNFSAITTDGEGNILTLEYNYLSGSSMPDEASAFEEGKNYNEFKTVWYIRTLDGTTGKLKSEHIIENTDDFFFTSDSMLYDSGNIYLISENTSGSTVAVLNADGSLEAIADCPAKGAWFIRLNTGAPALCGYEDSGITVREITSPGVSLELIASSSDAVTDIYSGFSDYAFCYNINWKLYGYNSALERNEFLLSWPETGLKSADNLARPAAGADDLPIFINMSSSADSAGKKAVIVTLAPQKSESDALASNKKELILLTCSPNESLCSAVAEFNNSSEEYTLKIADFSSYCAASSNTSPEAAMNKYIADELNGTPPDILDLSSLPYFKLAAQGSLQDLYSFIDSDPYMQRDDFVPGILEALEYNGNLYASCAGFTIDTLLAPSDAAGDSAGWSIDEYNAALSTMKSGCSPFDVFITSGDIFKEYIRISLNAFIDWESGTCGFNSDEFKSILSFASSFPADFDSNNYNWENGSTNSDLRINRGEQMLLRTGILNMRDAIRIGYEFPGDVSFKGYPSAYGNGSIFNISSEDMPHNFAIMSISLNKDGAWQFIRTFFTSDYQQNGSYFPSNMALFQQQLDSAMKVEYVLDSEGQPVIGKKTGEPVERSKETMYLSDFTAVKCYAMTQAKADKLLDLIKTTKAVDFNNDEILKLIYSAVKDCFSGETSIDAAAANAQNVITLYLDNLYRPAETIDANN